MKPLNDNELDALLKEEGIRRAILADVEQGVRKELRRRSIRRWVRAAVFAFGLPAVFAVGGAGLVHFAGNVDAEWMRWVVGAGALASLWGMGYLVAHFSID